MTPDYNNIFRIAREASSKGDFKKARELYFLLWKAPTWNHDKEVQLHYAYACERSGDHTEALEAYKQLIRQYHSDAAEVPPTGESMAHLREVVNEDGGDLAHVLQLGRDAEEARLVAGLFRNACTRTLKPGEILCRESEVAGQLWLLYEGALDVIVPGQGTSRVEGSEVRPCILGEVAYFTGMRRTADLFAATEVKVLELPFAQISQIVNDRPDLGSLLEHLFRRRLVLQVLSKHDIFKRFNDVDRLRVAMMFENLHLQSGAVLAEQGSETPDAFMVQSGTMLLLRRDGEDKETLIGSMQPGDIFHLGGLLRGFCSPYRIIAGTPARLLRLSRETLEPFMLRRPWLIKALIKQSRMTGEQQIMHPEARHLWSVDRYVDLDKPLS